MVMQMTTEAAFVSRGPLAPEMWWNILTARKGSAKIWADLETSVFAILLLFLPHYQEFELSIYLVSFKRLLINVHLLVLIGKNSLPLGGESRINVYKSQLNSASASQYPMVSLEVASPDTLDESDTREELTAKNKTRKTCICSECPIPGPHN